MSKSYEVIKPSYLERKIKRLLKKYPSLDDDIDVLISELETNPTMGTPLGMDCYKIRLKISSKKTGKSGGARVITCVKIVRNRVYLLTIYDKSEQDSITDKYMAELLEAVFAEREC